jgi:hypothetical protein
MSNRLAQFRRLLEHARTTLGIGFGFVLWDGSTVPADWPADALALAIADEGAVAALIQRWFTPAAISPTGTTISRPGKLTRYIFPGGELDHIGMSLDNLQRHGFEMHDTEAWREHCARTWRLWHDRLLNRFGEAVQAVGSVQTGLWLVYLAGCSLASQRNTGGIYQTLASKRGRGPSGLPPTRANLYC